MVLTPTRWKLRRAVALLNGIFTTLGLEKDPHKTFIGRVEKGFDFLGYRLGGVPASSFARSSRLSPLP